MGQELSAPKKKQPSSVTRVACAICTAPCGSWTMNELCSGVSGNNVTDVRHQNPLPQNRPEQASRLYSRLHKKILATFAKKVDVYNSLNSYRSPLLLGAKRLRRIEPPRESRTELHIPNGHKKPWELFACMCLSSLSRREHE